MTKRPAKRPAPLSEEGLSLETERLGPLPIINRFIERLDLDKLFERFVPTKSPRARLTHGQALGVLMRSIIVEREPIYRQGEFISVFAPELFDIEDPSSISDDRIGRALDRLFDADRGTFLTTVVAEVVDRFKLSLEELHNDSTSVRFCGQYRQATGRSIRGQRAPYITYGYSKDHRPDLKQLLFILTVTADGGIPVLFRCEDGNTNDSRTHVETWESLVKITGGPGFLYVADSKLCSHEAMDHIDGHEGRFITVMPRTRKEDSEFREWVQQNRPEWELVWDRPNPDRERPRDKWFVYRHHLPSKEGWPVTWVYSVLLALHQRRKRRERLAKAQEELGAVARQLGGRRPRIRSRADIKEQVSDILERRRCQRYLKISIDKIPEHRYRQTGPGRPGPATQYRRETKTRWELTWALDEERIAYDRKSDGMYPLLTNERRFSAREILEAHKRQPEIEKRFGQLKSVMNLAPVFLKNESRIEALFFVYFLALLLQCLVEREIRNEMKFEDIEYLPIYPEERQCRAPTAEQIFRLFSSAQRSLLFHEGTKVKTFAPKLTELQREVLLLLSVPKSKYLGTRRA